MIRLFIFLLLFPACASAQTWEEYVEGQIKHQQDMELEERKIEVLARMERMGAANINVSNQAGATSGDRVFFGRKNNRND